MKINEDKTKAMIITSSAKHSEWRPNLEINGRQLEMVKTYKFLGVKMSSDLRFRDHVEGLIQRGRKRVNILKCTAGKDWGQTMETQRILYTGYVRNSLEYAVAG